MDVPSAPTEDVLAQPTRARLFALLTELRRPAGTVELAERLRLHPNGVRIHLERMQRAGLVQRTQARAARGRPPDTWMITPTADPGGHPPRGYQDLGRWLARALHAQPDELRSVEETGRQIGRELAPAGAERDPDAFMTSLTTLGFQPVIERRENDRVSFCLHNCPYVDAVHENQPVVCALHLGMTRGLLEVLQPDAKLTDFVPHDPDEAGCTVELQLTPQRAADRGC